eukprot:1539778-Prorocentrum_lima.AAC.1
MHIEFQKHFLSSAIKHIEAQAEQAINEAKEAAKRYNMASPLPGGDGGDLPPPVPPAPRGSAAKVSE